MPDANCHLQPSSLPRHHLYSLPRHQPRPQPNHQPRSQPHRWPHLAALILCAAALRASSIAWATPFTLPAQRLSVDLSFNYEQAGSQWTITQHHDPFPLGGHFSSSAVQLGVRYGILDSLEVQVRTSYKIVTYTASPVHLFTSVGQNPTSNILNDQIFDFSGQETGIGDIYAGLSYRPFWRHVNTAIEAELKIPTGYRTPTGTLCANTPPM